MDFNSKVADTLEHGLVSERITTFQVNISLKCNQECTHCHHRAGPDRTEIMSWDTMLGIIEKAKEAEIEIMDITGGAPEEHPHLARFIHELKENGHHIMVRTNLTALIMEEHRHLAPLFKEKRVEIIASLPCYEKAEVDCVRGEGVFQRSIEGLKLLNSLGYGRDPDLKVNLVFNPMADFLPPPQKALKAEYKEILKKDFDVDFNDIFTITNMPIGRFWEDLTSKGKDKKYMGLLMDSFNPVTIPHLMCLSQLNIAWDGTIYDCDFNQAIGLTSDKALASNIKDLDINTLNIGRKISTGNHCFGCAAGTGSSCGGSLVID